MKPDDARRVEQLIAAIESGSSVQYLPFWGHRPTAGGAITKSCFSQWFASPFKVNGEQFATAEHFMMVSKAELFGDLFHF